MSDSDSTCRGKHPLPTRSESDDHPSRGVPWLVLAVLVGLAVVAVVVALTLTIGDVAEADESGFGAVVCVMVTLIVLLGGGWVVVHLTRAAREQARPPKMKRSTDDFLKRLNDR